MSNNTKLVAILNITPDSFSDGGLYTDKQSILSQVHKLITDGASIIDVGAESTRPGATALTHQEEWQRLESILPNIVSVCHEHNVLVSLDTYHPESAAKAISFGVDWINDVNGLKDANMIEAVRESETKLVVMHSLTVPANKDVNIIGDPIAEIYEWAINKINELIAHDIRRDRIIFDPGVGFNKDSEQSWDLIKNIHKFKTLDVPIYVGHSRKSFLGNKNNKDQATIEVSKGLVQNNVDYIRVHDIESHAKILN